MKTNPTTPICSPTGCHCQNHRSNNNPRTRGDLFYLNSLRRVLFYGDDKCQI
ncbi:hypothetical protein CT104_003284 [Salmonella enterica subsp. enterica serovar Anatum]|nr:hypothetical protein [Salmonella enterica subsp. enterica serovar Anatum]